MSTLFAGPFIGEFGIELFMWQGYVRKLAESFDKVIVSSRLQNKFLYEDFCTEFVPFEPKSYDCDGFECIDKEDIPDLHLEHNPDMVIRTLRFESYLAELGHREQKFFSYKTEKKHNIDVCICARNFTKGVFTKTSRNWDFNNCMKTVSKLLDKGLKVASVGLSCSARYMENTENYMDISLKQLAEILSSAKMIIGPSSGVMHFASLCECPQLVWGEKHLENRYKNEWNPFNTNVKFIGRDDYTVAPEEILDIL